MLVLLSLTLLLGGCDGFGGADRPIFATARHDADGDGQFVGEEDVQIMWSIVLQGDEAEVKRISDPAFPHMGANVSRSGKRMVYSSWREDTDGNGVIDRLDEVGVYISDLDGGNEVEVVRVPQISAGQWSRDGSRFAVRDESQEWVIVNADGSGERRLSQDEFLGTEYGAFDATISPDGKHRISMLPEVGWFVFDPKSPPASPDDVVPLAAELASYMFVAWSPDSQHILLILQEEEEADVPVLTPQTLYVIDPDGSGLMQVTSRGLGSPFAKWSPDGTRVLFLTWWEDSDGDGKVDLARDLEDPALYVAEVEGSREWRLLDDSYRVDVALGW
jgi:hypothetical protein